MVDDPTTAGSATVQRSNGVAGAPTRDVQARFGLAYGWLRRGQPARAAEQFLDVLELDPDLESPYLELAEIYVGHERWEDAIAICRRGLARFPNQSRLHKANVTALTASGGHDAACAHYQLGRVDDRRLDIAPDEILACLVVRDEVERLPWFVRECRRLGVTRILAVDNGSTDGTVELLLAQPDVHLWRTHMSFNAGNFGSAWFEVLLREYGVGHWVLMLDADEVLRFPGSEHRTLNDFCATLDDLDLTAASGLLLDMYSDRPIAETRYVAGEDFLDHCPFFDRHPYHEARELDGPYRNLTYFFGGMRKRRFGDDAEYLVTKVPLLKYGPDVVLAGGQHWTNQPVDRIAHQACAVLHFKYFASFVDYAHQEAERAEHSEGGRQYQAYRRQLDRTENLVLFDPTESLRFRGSGQLVELGWVLPVSDGGP